MKVLSARTPGGYNAILHRHVRIPHGGAGNSRRRSELQPPAQPRAAPGPTSPTPPGRPRRGGADVATPRPRLGAGRWGGVSVATARSAPAPS